MLRPTGLRRQSNPQPSEFEAALRHTELLLAATNVTVPSGEERQPVSITGEPEVSVFDPDRKVIWTVDGSAVQFDLTALLAKPQVASTTALNLNSTNAVVHSMGSTLCMLARSTDSPSQFLFSADRAGTYSVAITVSSIDIEPWARRSSAAAIPASPPLVAGAGINVTDELEGRKRVAVTNPRVGAGGASAAADKKFVQPELDPVREWRLEAIQKIDPHVVRLVYDASAQKYQGTFPIRADGTVTAQLEYVRPGTSTSGNPDAGKFKVITLPLDTDRPNLFEEGTVDALILQMGRTEAEAVKARKSIEEVVKDTRTTNTLAIISKAARVGAPFPLDTAATAYVRINFRLTGGPVAGWNRDSSKDVDPTELRAARSGIAPGALAVVQNGVVLVGDRYSGTVYAFKDGRRFPGADITTGIGFSHVNGMSCNLAGNKLAVMRGGYGEEIRIFTLSQPGTAGQTLTELCADRIEANQLDTGGSLSRWCIAWHGDDLWVIDRHGFARVFHNPDGSDRIQNVEKKPTLPGTDQVFAATFVGDVLIYGGDGAAVYAYNVATKERVPELELTASQVRAGM